MYDLLAIPLTFGTFRLPSLSTLNAFFSGKQFVSNEKVGETIDKYFKKTIDVRKMLDFVL